MHVTMMLLLGEITVKDLKELSNRCIKCKAINEDLLFCFEHVKVTIDTFVFNYLKYETKKLIKPNKLFKDFPITFDCFESNLQKFKLLLKKKGYFL